jgi:hypothetical protein
VNKQQMVDRLMSDSSLSRHCDGFGRGLPDALRRRGAYDKMSERALRRELQLRGLLEYDDPDLFGGGGFDDDMPADALLELGMIRSWSAPIESEA